jgi:hypothetical protein
LARAAVHRIARTERQDSDETPCLIDKRASGVSPVRHNIYLVKPPAGIVEVASNLSPRLSHGLATDAGITDEPHGSVNWEKFVSWSQRRKCGCLDIENSEQSKIAIRVGLK